LIARQQCASSSRRNNVLGASPKKKVGVSVRRLSNQLRFSRMNTKRNLSCKENMGTTYKDPCFWGEFVIFT